MADYQYITLTGTIIPDTGEVKATVEQEYKNAFGADLVVNPSTPQGLMITAETLARSNMLINNAALANQINPNIAGGIFLDSILALTGAEREDEVFSIVTGVVLTGVAGTFIAAGAQAKTTVGDVFASLTNVTLDVNGTATVTFQAIVSGPVPIGAATLTSIVSNILGWETVNNPDAGVAGTLQGSDESTRVLRRNTLAAQGTALPEAIISALYLVTGVTSVGFAENYTDSTITYEGATLIPHSIYVVVNPSSVDGYQEAVANSLLKSKSMGCAYNGTVEQEIIAPISKQPYLVKFDYATVVNLAVRVTIRSSLSTSVENPDTAVKDALMSFAAGLMPNTAGLKVGQSVSCFELAGAINYYSPGIYVFNVETAIIPTPGTFSSAEIPITFLQMAALARANITVVQA